MIVFTNTLTGKKEEFKSGHAKKVSLYVCGVTPYDFSHIGHGRCYVTFDFIYRLLQFSGYTITYCRNYTDIDDKILDRAEKEFGDRSLYKKITETYIEAFEVDMQQLNCAQPDVQPRVTDLIPEIILFVQGLIEKNAAYERNGSVYFRVKNCAKYGELSKQNISELLLGARVDIDESKENPLDFALWKRDDVVGFDSPWGRGRPGWHIECSAMAQKVFANTVDIHGGGMDLIFPHHENEIAQSQALYDRPFVRYWLHNAFVRINQEKMSKSLGNFFTLKEVFKTFDPMVVRFYFLKQHYRNPLDFSLPDLQATEKAYKKIVAFFADVSSEHISAKEAQDDSVVQTMLASLHDDVNTSGAIGILFESMTSLQDRRSKEALKYFIQSVFGLTLQQLPEKTIEITPEIEGLINQRKQARDQKNWKLADEIRDRLLALGVTLQDKKIK